MNFITGDEEVAPLAILDFADFFVKNRFFGKAPLFLGGLVMSTLIPKILYHPILPECGKDPDSNTHNYRKPEERQLNNVNVNIKTKDLNSLQGWFIKSDQPKINPTIVFFHENAGNIGHRLDYLEKYVRTINVNIFIVAYRGFSKSTGTPSQKGIEIDAESILDFVFNEKNLGTLIDTKKVYLHGRSLGGAVAIYAATLEKYANKVQGIIVENSFTSITDIAINFSPSSKEFIEKLMLNNNDWRSLERIKNIKCHGLFIASMMDELVPPKQMLELYNTYAMIVGSQNLNKKVELYAIDKGDHNSNWMIDPQGYFAAIHSFILSTSALSGQVQLANTIFDSIRE